jgi:hypothetical protein
MEWIIQRSSKLPRDQYLLVEPFYQTLPNQSDSTIEEVARGDLKALEDRWGWDFKVKGKKDGIESLAVRVTDETVELLEWLHKMRADKQLRRTACRDAMVDWLYAQDAVNSEQMAFRDVMLYDRARSIWWGQPFTSADLDVAAGWLDHEGLANGIITSLEAKGPEFLYLTDKGVECAEQFSSDTRAYLARRPQIRVEGDYVEEKTDVKARDIIGAQIGRDNTQAIINSFNKFADAHGAEDDLATQMKIISDIIATLVAELQPQDPHAATEVTQTFQSFAEESAKEAPRAGTLRVLGKALIDASKKVD